MFSSVSIGRMSGWSFMDRWTSCLSTTWWPVRSGPLTLSSTTARNPWPTTWRCPTSCWGSWRMENCSTPWGLSLFLFTIYFLSVFYSSAGIHVNCNLEYFPLKNTRVWWNVGGVCESQVIVCRLQPFSAFCGSVFASFLPRVLNLPT